MLLARHRSFLAALSGLPEQQPAAANASFGVVGTRAVSDALGRLDDARAALAPCLALVRRYPPSFNPHLGIPVHVPPTDDPASRWRDHPLAS